MISVESSKTSRGMKRNDKEKATKVANTSTSSGSNHSFDAFGDSSKAKIGTMINE